MRRATYFLLQRVGLSVLTATGSSSVHNFFCHPTGFWFAPASVSRLRIHFAGHALCDAVWYLLPLAPLPRLRYEQKANDRGAVLDLASPATVTDPLSHTTTFGYDTKINLTTITNALNTTTTLTVNSQAVNQDHVPGRTAQPTSMMSECAVTGVGLA